ncbi:MAG: hypothetical protein GY722_10495 [bacterium]|nr:hypothetical protein [bacterium]
MNVMTPDALIEVRFLTTGEGGRSSPIEGDTYGCPLIVNGRGFDCRFVLKGSTRFDLGEIYRIEVKFLCADYALRELEEETEISLWEGRIIAKGRIVKLFAASPC